MRRSSRSDLPARALVVARVALAATVLVTLAACGTAPTTEPDPGPDPDPTVAEFGTATWNDATWQ